MLQFDFSTSRNNIILSFENIDKVSCELSRFIINVKLLENSKKDDSKFYYTVVSL